MINIAIVGATGLVGQTFLKVLEEKKLNNYKYTLFASNRSKDKIINFMNEDYIVKELTEESFEEENFDYALFSAGGEISKKFIPLAVKTGCIVIDNSSFFRMNDGVPLIVPEVNKEEIFKNKGIISNPNCSTIQAVIPIKALNDKFKIKRIIYSTYQAVSGAGNSGVVDLKRTRNGKKPNKFKYNISKNCIPQIDTFLENGYTKEEIKMIEETKKILKEPKLPITATCVRVPVENSHSESINIEFEDEFNIQDISNTLRDFENIEVIDDTINEKYPINEIANNTDGVFIGRIRRDFSVKNGINIWVVSDNIRKGAATNAIQILQNLLEKRELN